MVLDNNDKYILATKLMEWDTTRQSYDNSDFVINDGANDTYTAGSWNPMDDEDVVEAMQFKLLETLRSK